MANNLVQKQLNKMFRSYFYIGIIKRAITMYYLCIVEKKWSDHFTFKAAVICSNLLYTLIVSNIVQ